MPRLPKTEAPPTQNSQGVDKAEDEEKGQESRGAIMDESGGLGEKFNTWKEYGKIALFGLGAVLVCAFLTLLAFPNSHFAVLVGAIVGLVLAALICITMLLKLAAELELQERTNKGAAAAAKLQQGDDKKTDAYCNSREDEAVTGLRFVHRIVSIQLAYI